MNFSNYQIEFKKLLNRDYFSADIHPLRKDAFSKLMTVGLPTQKWEEWRFTNLSDIINNNYSISDANDSPDVCTADIATLSNSKLPVIFTPVFVVSNFLLLL